MKEEVIFEGQKFIERRYGLLVPDKRIVEPPVTPSEPSTIDLRLSDVRTELASLPSVVPAMKSKIIEVPQAIGGDSPIGEKEMKRRIRTVKEQSPKSYKEKLLIVSDLQLLHEANDEGIGALLKYITDQGKTFTHVVLNGDIIDFQQQTGFRKDNQLGDSVTVDEQVAGRWFIDFINTHCPKAKKVFMKGNHEARYDNMYLDSNNGIKQYLKPFDEVFGLTSWEVHEYGESYDWHGRKIRHGTKTGTVQNIPKIEMDRNWRPNSVGHAITNRMWEFVDADGNSYLSFVHAGFSKTATYDKTGDKKPSNGFGVYYWTEIGNRGIESPYQVIFGTSNPRFIGPEGHLYDGKGFNLRKAIGLDSK